METRFGFPVVNADNYLQVFEDLGIRPWPRHKGPMPLEKYLASGLTEEQKQEVARFGPRAEALVLEQPNGKLFTGFRSVGKNWASVFTLLPGDFLPIVAEFKHGSESISIVQPSGVPSKKDFESPDPMATCAKREFEEETGIALDGVEYIGLDGGIPVSARQSTQRYFPFLGHVKEPIMPGPKKLDETEHLKGAIINLREWLKLMERGEVYEDCPASLTLLALLRLGRLNLVY